MKIKIKKIYKYVIKLFLKLLLVCNTKICSNKTIALFVVKYRYSNLLNEVITFCNTQRFLFSKPTLIKAVLIAYYQTNKKNRKFLKEHISLFKVLPDVSSDLRKSQRRNDLCNCGSGIKFKNCCLKKY